MTPTDGRAAATDPDPGRAHLLTVKMETLAGHDGDYQVRRLVDEELVERTPDLERAIAVADAEPFGAYVDYVRVCEGDPLGLGLSVRQRSNVRAQPCSPTGRRSTTSAACWRPRPTATG